MAKHVAKCPKCGSRVDLDTAVGERIICANCQAPLSLPGKGKGPSEADPLIGKTLGEFEVLERIGSGGMGAVYKARQPTLDRFVAIKTLPGNLAANEDFVQRFHREARTAANLRHTHLVQVYAVGEAEGVHYIAMEYVDGEGLNAVLRREGPLPQERALQLLKEVCAALAHAHAAGVVHRDIKPSNLMIDSHGSVRVTDFGLAKRIEGDVEVTQAGTSLGTPLYMAPEVAAGKPAAPQSDLYSLGATFYHLLVGQPPFEGKSYSELIVKHVNEPAPKLADTAPHVDRRLAHIITKLLHKDPAQRHASAQALLEEIEALERMGPLQMPTAALQAQGRAMIAEAPTVTMSAGRRLEREVAAKRYERRGRAAKKRSVHPIAIGGAVALAGIILFLALRGGGGEPRTGAAAPPAKQSQEKQNAQAREHNASVLFRTVQRAATDRQWQRALDELSRLEAEYADTQFHAANQAAIARLRARALAELRKAAGPTLPPVPSPGPGEGWVALFDGKTLSGWEVVERFPTAGGPGRATVVQGRILLEKGDKWAAISCSQPFPLVDYEVEFDAMRIDGKGSFCLTVFPVSGARATLDIGGWGGTVVGIAGLDGKHATENETTKRVDFQNGRWYRVRLRVAAAKVQLWIDGKTMFDLATAGRRFGLLTMMREIQRFGIAADTPKAALANIRFRRLQAPAHVAAVPKFFHGALSRLPDGRVELRYDWSDPAQLRDWTPTNKVHPITIEDDELRFGGKASQRQVLVAPMVGDVEVEATWCVREPAGGEPSCLVDVCVDDNGKYAAQLQSNNQKLWRTGGITWGHGHYPNGQPHKVRMVREGDGLRVWINGELQMDHTDPARKKGQVRIGAWNAKVSFDDVRVVGTLAPEWLAAHPDAAKQIAAAPLAGQEGPWVSLFDGKTLQGWKVAEGFPKATKGGDVGVADGKIVVKPGNPWSGVAWTGDFPKRDYEVSVDAMRVEGGDAFCMMTFPVADGDLLLVVGGWDGRTIGMEHIDGRWGHNNETTTKMDFERGRWYRVRLRVSGARVQAWIDDGQVVSLVVAGRRLGASNYGIPFRPFGLGSAHTTAAFRNIRLRRLGPEPGAVAAAPKFFHGAVSRLPDGRVELRYDWSDAEQLRDWKAQKGTTQAIVEGDLRFGGNKGKGTDHVASFVGDVEIAGRLSLRRAIASQASCAVGVCRSRAGNYTAILKNGGSRMYKTRGTRVIGGIKARCEPGKWYAFRIVRVGDALQVWVDENLAAEITEPELTQGGVGLGSWNADVGFKDIRIIGKPDPQWLAAHPDAAKQIAAAPLAGAAVAALPKLFHGAVSRLPDGRVELRYDWKDEAQLRDWKPLQQTSPSITDGELRFAGGLMHMAPFVGGVEVTGSWRVVEATGPGGACGIHVCANPDNLKRYYGLLLRPGYQSFFRDGGALAMGSSRVPCGGERPHTFRLVRSGDSLKAWINDKLEISITDRDYSNGFVRLASWSARVGYSDIRIIGRLDPKWLAARVAGAKEQGWVSLFDGKTLDGWRMPEGGHFKGNVRERIKVADGCLVVGAHQAATGVVCTQDIPRIDYELAFEVKCTKGGSLAATPIFPVGDSHSLMSIRMSSKGLGLDLYPREPGIKKPVFRPHKLVRNRWYRFLLRVEQERIRVWLDGKQVFETPTKGFQFRHWDGFKPAQPLGFITQYSTEAWLRNIRIRRLRPEPVRVAAAALGPMVAKPVEPFEETFEAGNLNAWQRRAGSWRISRGSATGRAQGNGWLEIKNRTFDDFVLEADVTDTGQKVGFAYGLVFRKVGQYELMFSLSTQYKSIALRGIRDYVPQPAGNLAGIRVGRGGKRFTPKPGQTYHMKVECIGTRVRCYLDDKLVGEATDTALLSGRIRLFVHRAEVRFDNIRIRPPQKRPAEDAAALARAWLRRAERLDVDKQLSAETKLEVWSDLLARWPKATGQPRQRQGHWHKVVADTVGLATQRSKELAQYVFNTKTREVSDGRIRIYYPADERNESYDWQTVRGFAHIGPFGRFCMHIVSNPLNAYCWNFRHGEDFKVAFRAHSRRTYGCTVFGLAGDPLESGIVLTVGAQENRTTTLGPAGQKPWSRSDVDPTRKWQHHEIEVSNGLLTYKYERKEVFRRKIDVSQFRGRRFILWAKPLPIDRGKEPFFDDVAIVSHPQEDWTRTHLPGGPPQRRSDQPDANGWFGMVFPDDGTLWMRSRGASVTSWGRMGVFSCSSRSKWVSSWAQRGAVRDCVITARVEFTKEGEETWNSFVGLTFRYKDNLQYLAGVQRRGGALLRQRSRRADGYWAINTLAQSDALQAPQGVFRLVAVVQGKRVELYCNGQLALTYDRLPEHSGTVGLEVRHATVIVHDFKFRPLPSDPNYEKIYGKKAP